VSRIWLSSPHMGENERKFVEEAFSTNWVAPLGPNVDFFEKQLSEYVGVKAAVTLNSGTAALHLALSLLDVNPGDIVMCQSFTFAASAFPITYCGAEPVFIDSEADTWNIDPQLLEYAIADQLQKGKKIAAIVVVHLYGMPAKMDELIAISEKYRIPIIEDAAEALGSRYNKKACGSFGKVGVLSFNGNKIITTSGGGALLSNDETLVTKTRHVSAQAKDPAPYYLHTQIGYNYRLSNICAGIGRGQMEVLPERIEKRRSIFEQYKVGLAGVKGISFLEEPNGFFSNRWLTTVVFDENHFKLGTIENLRIYLETLNIETRPLWKPLHQQPVFASCLSYNNGVSDRLFATGLCLPSGSNLPDTTIENVILEIKKHLGVQ